MKPDPDSEENERMSYENRRDVFAARMQFRADRGEFDEDFDCDHQYAERIGGCKCIHCGHFIGNWE